MNERLLILAIAPLLTVLSFFVHWAALRRINTPEERLPFCRGTYLALSFQLLLYAWIVLFLSGRGGTAFLIPMGMTFSFAGDFFNLQFPSVRKRMAEPVFAGILCFMAAQGCYIGAFLSMSPFYVLADRGYFYPLLAALTIGPAILFRLRVYSPSRPKPIMHGAFVYGFMLGAMAAVAIAAAISLGGFWKAVALGALFFLLSDAVMGETTIHGRHPVTEYQIPWVTYLAAQGLILYGTALLLIQ